MKRISCKPPAYVNLKELYKGKLMLNYLWAGMILVGIIFAAFTGRMPDITNAALDSSK